MTKQFIKFHRTGNTRWDWGVPIYEYVLEISGRMYSDNPIWLYREDSEYVESDNFLINDV